MSLSDLLARRKVAYTAAAACIALAFMLAARHVGSNFHIQGEPDSANVRSFGARGDGRTDDTTAIQAAIAHATDFRWQGSTRRTEALARGGEVYFPPGTYRITRKLLLSPGLILKGCGTGTTYTEANIATSDGGSHLYVDYPVAKYTDYALDTANWNADGHRELNALLRGEDSSHSKHAFCEGISIRDIHIAGTNTCSGLNLAGTPFLSIRNVRVTNFVTGIRISACWGGSLSDTIIRNFTFRGLTTWYEVNNLVLNNCYIQGSPPRERYDPARFGYDGAEAFATEHWRSADQNSTMCGVYSFYGHISAFGGVIEQVDVALSNAYAKQDFHGLYCEGIRQRFLQTRGAGNAAGYYDLVGFKESRSAYLVWSDTAQVEIHNLADQFTARSFRGRIEFLYTAGQSQWDPHIVGFDQPSESPPNEKGPEK